MLSSHLLNEVILSFVLFSNHYSLDFFSPKVFIFHIVYKLLVFFHQPTLHTCMVTLYCNFTTRVCLPCLYPTPPSYISSVHELCQPAVLMLKPEWKTRSTDGGYPLFIRRISGFVLCTLALPSKLLILTKYSVSVYHLIFLWCDVRVLTPPEINVISSFWNIVLRYEHGSETSLPAF